jgi:hypothetical protein
MSNDQTFCAAKCVNALCDRNKIHTATAGTNRLLSWADFSADCVAYEPVDSMFIDKMPIETLMQKANLADGIDYAKAEAFYELSSKVAYRLYGMDGHKELDQRKLTDENKRGFEKLLKRQQLKETMLSWKEQKV